MPLRSSGRQFLYTGEFTRGNIIGLRTDVWPVHRTEAETQRDTTIVGRICGWWSEEGNVNFFLLWTEEGVGQKHVDERYNAQIDVSK